MADDNNLKRDEARKALAGEEWTAKLEQEEKEKQLKSTAETLEKRLGEIRAEKEKLELAWIDLDAKKKALRALVQPLQTEEKDLEGKEISIEAEEASTGVPESKHVIEQKRWEIQAKRKAVEEKRWIQEQQMIEIDKVIEGNTKRYRELLDEEDKLATELEQLKGGTNN